MRINIIPVRTLSDIHLKAEYKEIIMSIHYYKRSVNSPKGIIESKILDTYTLNEGHAYFWYNKFGYIKKRYFELLEEMKKRGYSTINNERKFLPLFKEHIPNFRVKDYTPTKEDYYVNLERILDKIYTKIYIDNKPNFYKLNKEVFSFIQWCLYYTEELDLEYDGVQNIISTIEYKYKEN